MLSNILKNNLIGSIILVMVLVLASLVPSLVTDSFMVPKMALGILYESAVQNNESRVLLLVLSGLSLLASAFVLNYYINKNESLTKVAYFSVFLFVLLSVEVFSSYAFHPSLFANLLILLGVMRLMESYRQDDAKALFFEGSFLISSSILIYFPSVTVLPIIFISLLFLRPFIWREWALAVLGIATPQLILLAIMYIMNRVDRYYTRHLFTTFNLNSYQPQFGAQYFVIFCVGFLLLLLFFKRLSGGKSRKIRQQKNLSIVVFWVILGLGAVFYESPYKTSIPVLCIPPMVILLSEWLGNIRRSTLSDFALLLLLCAFSLSVLQIRGFI